MTAHTIQLVELAERVRVGATIRELREARGFTQEEFATSCGVSRSHMANIEAGRKPLTKILLSRVATVLNVRQIALVREGYFTEDAAA